MRRAGTLGLPLLLVVALALVPTGVPAQKQLVGNAPFPDAGTFRFYLNEEVLITTHFTWSDSGIYSGEYTLRVGGQSSKSQVTIELDENESWTRVQIETVHGSVTVARQDSIARVTHKGGTATLKVDPGAILFENFSPALMSLAVRAYDQERGGRQVLPHLVMPSTVMEGSLERLDTIEWMVAGSDIPLTRYAYGVPGMDITLYVDARGKIVLGDVPARHGAYVREGYETLLRPATADTLLSSPVHEVRIDRNVGVPMRDGIALSTDLYRPQAPGRFPIILVRTPYKKEMNEMQGRFYARRGYVYAIQDCRGRFSSPGDWEPFVHEAEDGYDTVEWLASQSWSTGKVGMIGASYLGWAQWWAARDRPPHLTTIIPSVSPPDPYYNVPYEYGVFYLLGAIWWAAILESQATGDVTGKAMAEIADKQYARLLRHLPVLELDEKVLGRRIPYWRKWIAHPSNDEYWEPANFLDRLASLDIPVFHQSGWFDGDGIGTKLNYLRMRSHGHRYQKLVLGPWGHTAEAVRVTRKRDFGEVAIIDLQKDYLRWLDRWLKGIRNGIEEEPLVSIFIMGTGEWLHGNTYPLPRTRLTRYYLKSGGNANTSYGDGLLVLDRPTGDIPCDRYVYDPGDPTPNPNFFVTWEEAGKGEAGADEGADEGTDEAEVVAFSLDEDRQRRRDYYALIDAERNDILVYETPVLDEPLTIAGPISAVLYAASSARDTDWFMRLSEVSEDGEAFWLTEGKIRARYRNSSRKPTLLKPGAVCRYELDLWHTGVQIPDGSKLRLEVCSASFPNYSRNLNTGEHNEIGTRYVRATQTIYHSARHPSHVLLPVIP